MARNERWGLGNLNWKSEADEYWGVEGTVAVVEEQEWKEEEVWMWVSARGLEVWQPIFTFTAESQHEDIVT